MTLSLGWVQPAPCFALTWAALSGLVRPCLFAVQVPRGRWMWWCLGFAAQATHQRAQSLVYRAPSMLALILRGAQHLSEQLKDQSDQLM